MSKQTLITSRDDKGRHAVNLFAIEYDKAKLDEARAQKLNERGGELQQGIAKLIAELSVSNQFADEEVNSNYAYPKEYKGPKPIEEQIKALAKILSLDSTSALEYAENLPELPDGAEGWFAIPRWDKIAPTYSEAVQKILDLIGKERKFYNYRKGQLGSEYLRQHARTVDMLQKLVEQQSGDILIVAAQFGMRHRGKSVRRAHEVFVANEFGLGSLAVGSMLLTHPEREVQWEQLHMDCAGDEFAPDADGQFSYAPVFYFCGGGVEFDAHFVSGAYDCYGSVSAFIPQC